MAIWKHFRSWLEYTYDLLYRNAASGAAAPSQTAYHSILTNGITVTDTMTMTDIIAAEVSGNGYTRQPITFSDTRAWDATDSRIESGFSNTWAHAATGGNISWSGVVVIADSSAWTRKPVSSVDTANDRLTSTAHALSNGQRVTVRSTSTLPGGISANTIYFVSVFDANQIRLFTDAALTSLVNITSAGGGTIELCNANGRLCSYSNEGARTIQAGSSQEFRMFVATRTL